jgi:hypothetical protein
MIEFSAEIFRRAAEATLLQHQPQSTLPDQVLAGAYAEALAARPGSAAEVEQRMDALIAESEMMQWVVSFLTEERGNELSAFVDGHLMEIGRLASAWFADAGKHLVA